MASQFNRVPCGIFVWHRRYVEFARFIFRLLLNEKNWKNYVRHMLFAFDGVPFCSSNYKILRENNARFPVRSFCVEQSEKERWPLTFINVRSNHVDTRYTRFTHSLALWTSFYEHVIASKWVFTWMHRSIYYYALIISGICRNIFLWKRFHCPALKNSYRDFDDRLRS